MEDAHHHALSPGLLAILFAISPGFASEAPVWRFWKSADGLAATFAGPISVDPSGNVLIAHGNVTRMERLDGYGIFPLPQPSNPSAVYSTPGGRLWTLTEAGVWDRRNEVWEARREVRLPPHPIAAIPFGDSTVLVMGSDRLVEYDVGRRSPRTILTQKETGLGRFLQMVPARGGGVWIAGETAFGKFCAPPACAPRWREYRVGEPALKYYWSPTEGDRGEIFVSGTSDRGDAVQVRIEIGR